MSFLEVRASKARLKEIHERLSDILQSLAADAEVAAGSDADAGQGRYRLTLGYFPLDAGRDRPPRKRRS